MVGLVYNDLFFVDEYVYINYHFFCYFKITFTSEKK